MDEIFGIPMSALVGQLVIGLINGSFYALMSLGLAIIFGLLHVVNFAHGAQYMLGAFVAWGLLEYFGNMGNGTYFNGGGCSRLATISVMPCLP